MEKLIDLFKSYLISQKISLVSIKNYAVDLRNFLEWFTLHLMTKRIAFDENRPFTIGENVTREELNEYRDFLIHNKSPVKTINRRLSSLRKFGSFLVSQSWQTTNPAREITNTGLKQNSPVSENQLILNHFKEDLKQEGISDVTIKNYITDINQFFRFIN